MLAKEKEIDSQYQLNIVKEHVHELEQAREDMDIVQNKIIQEGNNLFHILFINVLLVFPVFARSFFENVLNLTSPFFSLFTLFLSLLFLVNEFKIKEVQRNSDSWYYRFFKKKKIIKEFFRLKEQYNIIIAKGSIELEELHVQEKLIQFLVEHKKFVSTDKIDLYHVGIQTLKDHLYTRHYKEAFELAGDLLSDINLNYKNPYLNDHHNKDIKDKEHKKFKKLAIEDFFKKHL